MGYKRKYTIGDRIESVDELLKQDFVYLFGNSPRSIRHISVIESMTLRTVMGFLKRGIYKAVKENEEVKAM